MVYWHLGSSKLRAWARWHSHDLIVEDQGNLPNGPDAVMIPCVLSLVRVLAIGDIPVILGLSSRLTGLGPARFAKTSEAINVS